MFANQVVDQDVEDQNQREWNDEGHQSIGDEPAEKQFFVALDVSGVVSE